MEKFTSKCLTWTMVFFIFGVALLLGAGFAGGFNELKVAAQNGVNHLNIFGQEVTFFNFGKSEYKGTEKDCDFVVDASQNARYLSIEADATNIKIVVSDENDIRVEGSGIVGELNATMEGSKCVIENKTGFNQFSIGGSSYSEITVYIPSHAELDGIDIDLGAGELEVSDINAGSWSVDIGAGNISMKDVVCKSLSVDCATGNLTYTGAITESGDFDMAAGNLEMTLDNFDDCNFAIEAALGHVKVGNDSYDSIGVDIEKKHEGATSTITVDAAVGSVIIK